jgi:hypothetical protein
MQQYGDLIALLRLCHARKLYFLRRKNLDAQLTDALTIHKYPTAFDIVIRFPARTQPHLGHELG